MRKFIMSLTTVASLSLAAVPVLGLTQAANAAERQVRIPVGDLDLSNPAQAAVFKARVQKATQALCRSKTRETSYGVCFSAVRTEVSNQLSTQQRDALKYAQAAQSVKVAAQ